MARVLRPSEERVLQSHALVSFVYLMSVGLFKVNGRSPRPHASG